MVHIRASLHIYNAMKQTQFYPTYLLISIGSFELQNKTNSIHVFMVCIGHHKNQVTNTTCILMSQLLPSLGQLSFLSYLFLPFLFS